MKKSINRSDIITSSVVSFRYFDKLNGNTYRIILVDIHLKDDALIRCYSPFGYGYGDPLNEIVGDLSKNNTVGTCKDVKDLLRVHYYNEMPIKYRDAKKMDRDLKEIATPLADIKIV